MERGKEWDRGRGREDNVMSVSFQSPRGKTGRLLISSYTLRFIFCYFCLIPFFYLFDSPSFLCLFNSHFYCYLPFNHIFYFSHFSYSIVPPLLVFQYNCTHLNTTSLQHYLILTRPYLYTTSSQHYIISTLPHLNTTCLQHYLILTLPHLNTTLSQHYLISTLLISTHLNTISQISKEVSMKERQRSRWQLVFSGNWPVN